MPSINIRPASVEDSAIILRFITELAIYEKAEDEVIATETEEIPRLILNKILLSNLLFLSCFIVSK